MDTSNKSPIFTNPTICAVCHSKNRGCCLSVPEFSDAMFGLTCSEITRITNETGLMPESFTTANKAPDAFFKAACRIHPVFGDTMPEQNRIQLKIIDNRCIFLENDGCRLTDATRPYFCRLYPFWFTPDDDIFVLASDRCLAQENAMSVSEILFRLGMKKKALKALFDDFLASADDHRKKYFKASP